MSITVYPLHHLSLDVWNASAYSAPMPPTNTPSNPSMGAIKKAAMGRRSPLYVWLLAHHGEFAKALTASGGHFRWADITDAVVKEGLTDSRGNPPSKETVVLTWRRVCKVVEARDPKVWGKRGRGKPVGEVVRKVETVAALPAPAGDFFSRGTKPAKRTFALSTPKRDYIDDK